MQVYSITEGFSPIILLTQCHHHRGTPLNVTKSVCPYYSLSFDNISPSLGGCSIILIIMLILIEDLDPFRFFF